MAAELGQFIRNQLSYLPENHPDRPLLESILGTTQAYIQKPTSVDEPKVDFQERQGSVTDSYLRETGVIDRFSDSARQCLYLAEDVAKELGHNNLGTEHILLGVLNEHGNANRILTILGAEANKISLAVRFIIARKEVINPSIANVIHPNITPRSKKVIELAIDESIRLNSPNVNSQELLLGLAREGEGIAAGVLESVGVNLERARLEVQRTFPPQTP